MKKITLLTLVGVAILVAGSVFAKDRRIWLGGVGSPITTSRLWDLTNPNWTDPNSPLSFLSTNFVAGATAQFDDSTDSLNVKVSGTMSVDSILINTSKNYVIDTVAGAKALLTGNGTLVKDGTGTLTMSVKNSLNGGTLIKNGRISVSKYNNLNVFGDTIVSQGGIINLATVGSTSANYATFATPIVISKGTTASVELARYSYFTNPISGQGDLVLYSAGERVNIPKTGTPDWSRFKGNVRLEKLVSTTVPGFWGIILQNKDTFKVATDGTLLKADTTYKYRRLTLGAGVTVGSTSGTRGFYFGEVIATDSTSTLGGYYTDSTTPQVYHIIGGLNTDVVYPGIWGYIGVKNYNQYGVYKIGTGTYTLTNKNNKITSGLVIKQGRILVSDKNIKGNYNGGTGASVKVEKTGILGGTGRIAGLVDVYGTLQPGANGVGTLTLADSTTANPLSKYGTPFAYSFKYYNTATPAVLTTFGFQNGGTRFTDLILREGSVTEFEIGSSTSYDKLNISGKIRFSKDTLSAGKPKLKIKFAPGSGLHDGDQFEIIKARSLDAANSNGFDIEYPTSQGVTWTVATKADTVKLAKETLTFTNHVVTKTSTDSTAITTVVTDSMRYTYKVIVTIHGSTAVTNPLDNNSISVYPNPTLGNVTISSSDAEIETVEVLNLQGQSILRKDVRSTSTNINLNNLASGVYYTKITTAKGTKVQKLLKQ